MAVSHTGRLLRGRIDGLIEIWKEDLVNGRVEESACQVAYMKGVIFGLAQALEQLDIVERAN